MKELTLRGRENLKFQILTSMFLCLLLSCAAFFFFRFAVREFHTFRVERRGPLKNWREVTHEFQEHITKEGISSTDLIAVQPWARENGLTVCLELEGGEENQGEGFSMGVAPEGPASILSIVVRYRDGDALTRFVYLPMRSQRFSSWVVSLLLAFDVFLMLSFLFLRKKLEYVLRIGQGLSILESGNLGHRIPVKGKDELARLAESVNLLGRSFQERILSEQRLLQVNRKIIGDLSHDIRTPLTVGIGYLTLLLEKEGLTEQERREYLLLALKKVEQIGERTRVLLDFATLSSGQVPVHKSIIDVRTLTEQLKEEISALADLHVEGTLPYGTMICGDISLLERLFDNLLSNLQKHGDTSRPILFRMDLRDGGVSIEIENAVDRRAHAKNSSISGSSLGLQICTCILELHGGRFETAVKEDMFQAKSWIPLCGSSDRSN